jgi:hypothetical protein
LQIRRLYCGDCNRIHHELPDCIVPYKRHCAETIEKIVSGKTDDAPCETETIRRIMTGWSIVLPYFLKILDSLTAKHGARFGDPPAFREIVRAVVNSNNWVFAQAVCTRSDSMSG